jgi:hypothetical protein
VEYPVTDETSSDTATRCPTGTFHTLPRIEDLS